VLVQDTPGGVDLIGSARGRAHLLDDVRAPISSACTADPFTNNGSSCPIAAVNAPFFLFTTVGSPQRLFSQALVGAVISSQLAQTDTVGILVQRLVSFARVHSKQVPLLKTVGKVPLGRRSRGQLKIDWNLKVDGHKLSAPRARCSRQSRQITRSRAKQNKSDVWTGDRCW
jgi:hypothetical protein